MIADEVFVDMREAGCRQLLDLITSKKMKKSGSSPI
jgi:hypothetical protein